MDTFYCLASVYPGNLESCLLGWWAAHSQVRKTLGVTFAGSTYEEKFLLADVDLSWSREHDRTHTDLAAFLVLSQVAAG